MDISFESAKTEKLFGDHKKMIQGYGCEMANCLRRRLDDLIAAPNLAEMYNLPGRLHQYSEKKPEIWSLDLKHPQRLLFTPTEPVPRLEDGGVNRTEVTKITICCIYDPHA